MFSIFGNFQINSEDRLQRLKLCLLHIERVKAARWIFNIRGTRKQEARQLITSLNLEPLTITHMESDRGWCADTLDLIREEPSEFIVILLEDHFLVANPFILEETVREMCDYNLDHMQYSWFSDREHKDRLLDIEYGEGNYISFYELNQHTNILLRRNSDNGIHENNFAISLASIIRTTLLKKICATYKFETRRFSHLTPFDMEKSGSDIDIFPVRTAIPKIEIFACLDDDNAVPSSSLQNRGLYFDLCSRSHLQATETGHGFLCRHNRLNIPKDFLGCSMDTTLLFNAYQYIVCHQEVQQNYVTYIVTHLSAINVALQIDSSISALIDYESISGLLSLIFLKIFNRKYCIFRSVLDHQALLAHENFILNEIYSGFKITYLDQNVTNSKPKYDGKFKIYANYIRLEATRENTTENVLLYLNVTLPNFERLAESVISDLKYANISVVILFGSLQDNLTPSRELLLYENIIKEHGFSVSWSSDREYETVISLDVNQHKHMRCTVYKRFFYSNNSVHNKN